MNLPAGTLLLGVLVFVAVALGTVALALAVEWIAARQRRKGVASQLQRLATEGLESIAPGAGSILRASHGSEAAWVQALSARLPHVRDSRHTLEQAGLGWTVQTYLLLVVGIALSAGLGTLLVAGAWLWAIGAAVIGGLLPYGYVRITRTRRLKRFEERFPDAIDMLGRGIRAGYPLGAALKMVAEEMPEPVSDEFRRVFEEQRFGLPFEDTITALADRVPVADVRIFVTAVLIQREVGGNLVEILDNLAGIIRQRFTLMRHVRTLTAEGRISAVVMGLLPTVMAGVFFLMNPDYIRVLFTQPLGHLMVAGALVLQALGFLWMRKLAQVEF